MKLIKLALILLLASCSKLDQKREITLHKEGLFFDENKMQNVWVDTDESYQVKVGEHFKTYIASYPRFTLNGQEVWVTVQVDGKEAYNKTAKVHNIDIKVE